METIKTNNFTVQIDNAKKEILVEDLTDMNNMPAAYNTKKRQFRQASESIKALVATGEIKTFSQAVNFFDTYKLNMHVWCMMD